MAGVLVDLGEEVVGVVDALGVVDEDVAEVVDGEESVHGTVRMRHF